MVFICVGEEGVCRWGYTEVYEVCLDLFKSHHWTTSASSTTQQHLVPKKPQEPEEKFHPHYTTAQCHKEDQWEITACILRYAAMYIWLYRPAIAVLLMRRRKVRKAPVMLKSR